MFCFQLTKSDCKALADPQKDGWKSTTMVGEQSVMTTSMIEMLQLLVINWDSSKTNIHCH